MGSRIIVKNLPKKISDEKFRTYFSKVGEITDAKLKFTKDGKFRQFGFVGFKSDDQAKQAIDYFNNTYIDASKLVVELCQPLNEASKSRPWSKYSKDNKKPELKKEATKKKPKKEDKMEKLLGPLGKDEEFIEFLEANKAIKSKESIWKNDINLDSKERQQVPPEPTQSPNRATAEQKKEADADQEPDFENGRLFVRNLCYDCKEEDLEKLFCAYGPLVEVNMPIDSFSKKPKGFAYITCMFPEKALQAFNELDGTVYQGRMLHIIAAKSKTEAEEIDEKNFKQKKKTELKKKAHNSHNWNSLFINQNSVANLMASRYQVDKSDIYDVHSSGKKSGSAAVKIAVGETQIVNDIRKFLLRNHVKLDAFSSNSERSKTIILIKNLPNETSETELKEFITKQKVDGGMKRFVMPEYGIACLIEFNERQEARDAFKKLAYRKFKSVPLYLEWAPVDAFEGDGDQLEQDEPEEKKEKEEKIEKEEESDAEYEENATLFVKNLNFDTDEDGLRKLFSKIGKCKATIARKLSQNRETLSMGYGFVKFKKSLDAKEAIKSLQGCELDGHCLEIKFSNRTGSIDSVKRKASTTTKQKSSKILVRNIPFEAKAKEIEELFKVFGELKYVRLPKKIDGAHRGFGFVDFVTQSDAERAFDALSHSTHFFGRRLVLEWAEPEQSQDVEILRQKEEQLSGSKNKRLKKSKILDDLGREEDDLRMDVGTEN
ncbi:putative RNA-binding 19 [Brachionus plicatilis]|uniref:Putative RNA-binding 19 n=1 Tax=Brachionus plicatilis TaxID=10195 RepID=A0A3M7RTY8_BRAPC|nr:putative RNA-binding 19 [Brachionus plicatilis]